MHVGVGVGKEARSLGKPRQPPYSTLNSGLLGILCNLFSASDGEECCELELEGRVTLGSGGLFLQAWDVYLFRGCSL